MRKPTRLPKRFTVEELLSFTEAKTISPNWYRVRELFAEVAHEDGLDAAEDIFKGVIFEIRALVPRKAGRPKDHNNDDFIYSQFARIVKVQNPQASDRQIAQRFISVSDPDIKRPTEKMIRKMTARFRRARTRSGGVAR